VAPERIWKWGYVQREAPQKIFVVPLQCFWFYEYNQSFWCALSWWSVQFGQFLICCRCPPFPAICKSGGHVPPCHMELAPLDLVALRNSWLIDWLMHCYWATYWFGLFSSFSVDRVSVVTGLLFDYQQNYNHTFLFAGSTMIFSGIIVLLPWLWRKTCLVNHASCWSCWSRTPITWQ